MEGLEALGGRYRVPENIVFHKLVSVNFILLVTKLSFNIASVEQRYFRQGWKREVQYRGMEMGGGRGVGWVLKLQHC